jgi:protein-disulfide isomerase
MRPFLIAMALLMSGLALAEQPLPSNQEVEAALVRNYGWKAGFTAKVFRVMPSSVPGMVQALVQLDDDQRTVVYITADGAHAIIGELIPFGADPFGPARKLLAGADGPARGGAPGGITLVEFSDLQCPYCKVYAATLDKLLVDFPQVRQVFQHYPLARLHPWAQLAAAHADCVGRADAKAFWRFVSEVYSAQEKITLEVAPARFGAIVTSLGMDPQAVAACAASEATMARVEASIALGQRLFVRGTPTAFLNGRQLPIGLTYDELKALVRFELERAGR